MTKVDWRWGGGVQGDSLTALITVNNALTAEVSRLQAEVAQLHSELACRNAQPEAVTLSQFQQHADRLQQQLTGSIMSEDVVSRDVMEDGG